MIHNAHALHIHPVICVFQQCTIVKHCIIPNRTPPMPHTHYVIYHRGSELTALLNNAFQRMHRYNCITLPENKFVKFTYKMDKNFWSSYWKSVHLQSSDEVLRPLLDSSHFYPPINALHSHITPPQELPDFTSIASVAELHFVQIATSHVLPVQVSDG